MSSIHVTERQLHAAFPSALYPTETPAQLQSFAAIAEAGGSALLELPTGSGKTGIGYTYLQALRPHVEGQPLYYVVPTKALVDQVASMHPDLTVAYGRHEHPCLYYSPETFQADEVPCLTLKDCPHRVDLNTGETKEEGATPCPYYLSKFQARQSQVVVCTMAFYLYNVFFSRGAVEPAGLVIDEAHRIADVIRSVLSYDISDFSLRRSIELLRRLGAEDEAWELEQFLKAMVRILRRKPKDSPTILSDEEIWELMNHVSQINDNAIQTRMAQAVREGLVDPLENRVFLRQLESIAINLRRYVRSLEFSMANEKRNPLSYVTYAYSDKDEMGDKRVQYKLVVRAYYVAPLVAKLLAPNTLAYSATVGDPNIFGQETGLKLPFVSLPGTFPAENTRVFMPNDTPNLATKVKIRQEPTKVLRRIARACHELNSKGIRALVVVVSNVERDKFVRLCEEEGVDLVSYNDEISPRQALSRFKEGEGGVLLGTTANYGEGIDLPEEMAPVIFFLRPSYPNPREPVVQFEERRFGQQRWQIWNWRVMIEALQVRGRNVRSADDRGVTIFISQQFKRFVYASLPTWVRPSYRTELSLDEALGETLELMSE